MNTVKEIVRGILVALSYLFLAWILTLCGYLIGQRDARVEFKDALDHSNAECIIEVPSITLKETHSYTGKYIVATKIPHLQKFQK